jgi:uncharacterized protein (DUF2252 family)
MHTIVQSTDDYEAWLRKFTDLWKKDLKYKHEQMAADDSFPFFRATYYRWAQHWQEADEELLAAPRVPSVGDIHVENFGTWRYVDGRLVWGVNDFDEADTLPYVHDLVRLAASTWFAQATLKIELDLACELLLQGYQQHISAGRNSPTPATPFVLEEHHPDMRALALGADRDPEKFWTKYLKLLEKPAVRPPAEVRQEIKRMLPDGARPEYRQKKKAGLGSLGKPRFVAIVDWQGGLMAREAKALTPPATSWLAKTKKKHAARVVASAVRAPDPFVTYGARWVTRRLAPRCSRIEMEHLEDEHSRVELLISMGAEIANIHLGRPAARKAIQKDLKQRKPRWLAQAAEGLVLKMEEDWNIWRGRP